MVKAIGKWVKPRRVQAWHRIKNSGWRVRSIVVATVVSILVTAGCYHWGGSDFVSPGTHIGAVFASWVGGLGLFLLGGLVIGIASLARPEDDSFDSRARILFKRQSGKHIDYIVGKLNDALEPYSENVVKHFSIKEYHDGESKFRIEQTSKATLRSYVDDVDKTFSASVKYRNVCPSPDSRPGPCINFIRIDGQPHGEFEEFSAEINREFGGVIPKKGSCFVETRWEYWIQDNSERNTHTPTRYTQELRLEIENQLRGKSVRISLGKGTGDPVDHVLKAGESRVFLTEADISPLIKVYDFTISST